MNKANKLALKLIDQIRGESVDDLLRKLAQGDTSITREQVERAYAVSEQMLKGR